VQNLVPLNGFVKTHLKKVLVVLRSSENLNNHDFINHVQHPILMPIIREVRRIDSKNTTKEATFIHH